VLVKVALPQIFQRSKVLVITKYQTQHPRPARVEDDALVAHLGSWRRLYSFVIVELAILILLFYLFTKAFE
jgi:hypothetical protein